ncbi:MAG: cupin domain-containing protein [Cellvibrio sp.]|nr:cupin domain-containing protein [Cellvibrio sp.]
MSYLLRTLSSILILISCTCTHALDQNILNEIDLSWTMQSNDVSVASVSGNEKSNGMYIYRVRFPKGHKIMPHYHSDERVVTVISGSLYVGYGNVFDVSKMTKLVPGGLWTEPKETAHFVWAKDGEVELQVVGFGPSVRTSISEKK